MTATNIIFFYAVFIILGGIFGYVKAKSIHSLRSGIASGIILILCSYFLEKGYEFCYWVATLGVGYLTYVFAKRYSITKKIMPSMVLALVSAATTLALLIVKFLLS